ncbi:histidine kinase dimerization/phospho-acceptor domain-containing protein [Salirhabdus sp. Marseille-P4669]|uniref:histidine kinase dimerization/phospho-acceptor domain-containing protein n=1 Tax=Salirhabdus sp. Marseille-P4669 TaxID=2042310 RepID=UPI000C7DD482|nr:histidine kinase dimerization/phospho-acceptor domain-containing protein [Salirhabdus sp. Marseille-P4669]
MNRKRLNNGGSDENYNNLIEDYPYGIIVVYDNKIKHINSYGMRLLGSLNRKYVIGKNIFSFIHNDDVPSTLEMINKVQKEATPTVDKLRFIQLNKEIVEVEVNALPTLYAKSKMIHIVLKEVNKTKHNLDLPLFIARGMAYEIENPITRIKGFINLMENGVQDEAYFREMKKDIKHIEHIIGEILSFEE